MDTTDLQPFIEAALKRYPDSDDDGPVEPYAICVNDTGSPHRNYDYRANRPESGVWVQAWVWVPAEEAVKALLLRGSEEQQ